MKTLVIGAGQVGTAIYNVIKGTHESYIRDVEEIAIDGIDVLQICYPDHKGFVETTYKYINQYKPVLTIINSSVEVGTSNKLPDNIVYSPVRGRHPKLEKDLRIYMKFAFSDDNRSLELALRYFKQCGLNMIGYPNHTAGEVVKLLSNIHMGIEIAWRQEVSRILKKFKVREEVYEQWEESYRKGYLLSGDTNLVRPSMSPDPIGGHCILQCTEILSRSYPSKVFDFVIESNEKAKREKLREN